MALSLLLYMAVDKHFTCSDFLVICTECVERREVGDGVG